MPILTSVEIDEVITAAVKAGLATSDRRVFLTADVEPRFFSTIPELKVPRDQLGLDLRKMNAVDTLPDGSVPLLCWLKNAVDASYGTQASKTFAALYTKGSARVPAASRPVDDQPLDGGGKEVFISARPLLRYAFLQEGIEIGRSVGKVLVPIFQDGKPLIVASGDQAAGTGTAWMIADSLMITNHHVFESRKTGIQVSQTDFALQVAATTVQFDYDDLNDTGSTAPLNELIAYDADLDYAVFSLKNAPVRKPLPLRPDAIAAEPGVPVNVIQHPNGRPKQIGIRDNSTYRPEGSLLLYFTNTLEGSSGAPVLDDFWQVVALHRGFRPITNFKFQGNETSVANYGTQIGSVLKSIKDKHAKAWEAIKSSQPGLDGRV